MNSNDNMDIEKLMRDSFRNAQATPPEGTWDIIASRLSTPPQTPKPSRHLPFVIAGALLLATAAGLLWNARSSSSDSHNDVAMASDISNSVQQTITTSSAQPIAEKSESSHQTPANNAKTSSDNKKTADNKIVVSNSTPSASSPKANSSLNIQPSVKVEQSATVKNSSAKTSSVTEPITSSPSIVSTTSQTTNNTTKATAISTPKNNTTQTSTAGTSATKTETSTDPSSSSSTSTAAPEIKIPNLITPNFDGINDYWVISGIEDFSDVHVQILNSQKKKVYENSHYNNQFCGDNLPDGQYIYILVIRSANISRKGFLVIKRQ